MAIVSEGFVWSGVATITLVFCCLVLAAAIVLFLAFGRKRGQFNEGLSQLEDFDGVPIAVVGALFRGKKSEVGAQEYIATLMALTNRGVLSLARDEGGSSIGLTIEANSQSDGDIDPVDAKAIDILRHFAEKDETVRLDLAKHIAEGRKGRIDEAYLEWKQLAREEAGAYSSISKGAARIQQAMSYTGYACVLLGALSSYLLSLMVCTIFLVTGAILIAMGRVMQRNINTEQHRARRLGSFLLNSTTLYCEEIAENRRSVQRALEYACLFGITDKVAGALEGVRSKGTVDEGLDALEFWKKLRTELYTAQ